MSEYRNIKTFLRNITLQIGQKNCLWLKKLKGLCCSDLVSDLNGEELVGTFYKKEF